MANPWMDPEYVAGWALRIQGGNPLREKQIGVVCRLADVGSPKHILELGIGTGAVGGRLLARLPESSLVGLDGSAAMLAQAIHHLPGDAKRDCYAKAYEVVRPGGTFLVSDRLALDARLFEHYRALWNRAREHGDFEPVADDFTHARYEARLEKHGDVPDRLETQLAWLRDVGFDPVDCFWLDGDRAVFGGLKAP